MGTLMDTDKEGNVRFGEDGNPLLQDAPRNEGERNLMRETASKVAGDLGLQVSELQAILWYAEQRLYRFYGIDASSVSYADAARKQFGNARPAENVGNGGTAKGGRSNADNGEAGRGPPKISEGISGSSSSSAGQEVVPHKSTALMHKLGAGAGQSRRSPSPNDLFHGTSSTNLRSIYEGGISTAGGAEYTSPFPEVAADVGHGSAPMGWTRTAMSP